MSTVHPLEQELILRAFKRFLAEQDLRPKTQQFYSQYALRLYRALTCGGVPLRRAEPARAAAWLEHEVTPRSRATALSAARLFSAWLRASVWPDLPVWFAPPSPRVPARLPLPLYSADERAALRQVASAREALLMALVLRMQLPHALQLTWADIDLDRQTLRSAGGEVPLGAELFQSLRGFAPGEPGAHLAGEWTPHLVRRTVRRLCARARVPYRGLPRSALSLTGADGTGEPQTDASAPAPAPPPPGASAY